MLDEKLKNEIISRLSQNVKYKKVILFGSYAKGNVNEDSDIDLIVVLDEKGISKSFEERLERIHKVSKLFIDIKQKIPMDILVYTEDEWKKGLEINSSIMREVLETCVILDEK